MRDYSVYVTLKNLTGEILTDGKSAATHGQWNKFPSSIPANSSFSFTLTNTAWFSSMSGTFSYNIRDAKGQIRTQMHTSQTDPYYGDNQVSYTPPEPGPAALYNHSFRTRVADGDWRDNDVDKNGHPLTVEYTIQYQRKSFRFEVNEITATSNHPIRNSRKELIAGKHTLWKRSNSSIYPDGNRGSFQPNVFAYTFGSRVAETGILDVKVRPLDIELVGAEVILFGTINGQRVIQSDYFFFKNLNEVTVRVHVVTPTTSARPFSLNDDVDWGMELRLSNQGLQRVGEGITRLELYWIATTLHRAFRAYIPVALLRNALRIKATVQAVNFQFYGDMTTMVFADYHKIYDTVLGAANFGVHAQGGNFWLEFYLLANDNNQPGALLPYVNCMDQAAMLELSCSLLGGFSSTSWLYQQPFGYINTTHLVGVRTFAGHLIDVNNPFFGTDSTRALVDINDGGRSGFGVHVYVGHSKPLDRRNDGIYDACGGPHTGTETIAQYVTSSIDTHTGLYQVNHTYPGTVNNVAEGVGVIGIDGQNAGIQLWRTKALLTESLSRLVNTAVDNVGTLAHVDWARLPIWLKGTLGDSWDVQYGRVTVSEAEAQAFWLISDANARDSPIRVHVNVVSVITQDGHLDMEASMAVVREHIGHILTSTERDEDVWTSRILPGLEEASLQYADNIAAGRILVVAENVVMDIMGMTSTEALLPYALKLLNKTVRRNRSPPVVPVLRREVITMGIDTDGGATTFRELEAETDVITITGIDTRFSVVFSVGCEIAAADAACDGTGVLFDRHTVAEPGSGEGRTVEFFFIVREVGRHCVHMYVVDLETMVEATSALEVEVVSA